MGKKWAPGKRAEITKSALGKVAKNGAKNVGCFFTPLLLIISVSNFLSEKVGQFL